MLLTQFTTGRSFIVYESYTSIDIKSYNTSYCNICRHFLVDYCQEEVEHLEEEPEVVILLVVLAVEVEEVALLTDDPKKSVSLDMLLNKLKM